MALPSDSFILDIDGVIFQGEAVIAGSAEALSYLAEKQVSLVFVTNNVSQPRDVVIQKLGLILPHREIYLVDPIDVLETVILAGHPEFIRSCFVMGPKALKMRLQGIGINVVDSPVSPAIAALLVSSDTNFDYNTLSLASSAVRAGTRLYATGLEPLFYWRERLWPGPGALVAALEVATGCKATVLGKPSKSIFTVAAEYFSNSANIIVIGDDIYTDIQGAKNAGYRSVLTLSGITLREQVQSSAIQPDYVVSSLHEFVFHYYHDGNC